MDLSEEQRSQVKAHLADVLASPMFRDGTGRTDRTQPSLFLEFVVSEELAGRGEGLDEPRIRLDCFHRRPEDESSPVRSAARSARDKLLRYYQKQGGNQTLRIELPEKGYRPSFVWVSEATFAPDPAERGQLPPERHLPAGSRMPFRSLGNRFVGRTQALWELYDLLFKENVAVVSGVGVIAGTGGLGKTQLAIEYARRFGYLYEGGVWWVEADQGLGAMITLVSGAAKIDVNGELPEREQAEQLWDALRGRAASLLVLDNFPDGGKLTAHLPTSGAVQALVTTRRGDLNHPKLALPTLEPGAALDLLNSRDRKFGVEAHPLLEALGRLPLAIELTCSFLNRRKDLDPPELLVEMRKVGEMGTLRAFAKRYGDQLPSKHELDIAATFQVSWDLLGAPARRTLRAIAEMAPAPIPLRLLRAIAEMAPPPARFRLLRSILRMRKTDLDNSLADSIAELERASLAERNDQGDLSIHRLVRSFVLFITPLRESMRGLVAKAVEREMARVVDEADKRGYIELETVAAHAEVLARADRVDPLGKANLWAYAGKQHLAHGRYVIAKAAMERSRQEAEHSLDPGHPNIAAYQSDLASVLRHLGELTAARDLFRRALVSAEASLEPGHRFLASYQSNLAQVLQDLGELKEARDMLRLALASAEASIEPGHPSIAIFQSSLALVLKDLGELEEARDLMRAALAADKAFFEPGHPSIASCQTNLAMVLDNLGEFEEARDLMRAALAADEVFFEPGHPSIAKRRANLATVLESLGELEEARDVLRVALASLEVSLGFGHPTIATCQANLARVLSRLGELNEARDLLRAAVAADKAAFELGHPYIANRCCELARVLYDLGEPEEALELLRREYRSLHAKLGPSHRNTKEVLVELLFTEKKRSG